MTIKDKLNNEDFIIQVKPTLRNDSEWTGEVDVSVITSSDNPLTSLYRCLIASLYIPIIKYLNV